MRLLSIILLIVFYSYAASAQSSLPGASPLGLQLSPALPFSVSNKGSNFPTNCPQGLTYVSVGDGCQGAQATGEPLKTTWFTSNFGVMYGVRPPWNVPGVDYHVGYDQTALKDPTVPANRPACLTVRAYGNAPTNTPGSGDSYNMDTSAADCTVDHFDFTNHCVVVIGSTGPIHTATFTNNKFAYSSDAYGHNALNSTNCYLLLINVALGSHIVFNYNSIIDYNTTGIAFGQMPGIASTTQAATMTNGQSSFSVTNSSAFLVNDQVFFDTNVNGFSTRVFYYVKAVNPGGPNTLSVSTTIGGTAVTATGGSTINIIQPNNANLTAKYNFLGGINNRFFQAGSTGTETIMYNLLDGLGVGAQHPEIIEYGTNTRNTNIEQFNNYGTYKLQGGTATSYIAAGVPTGSVNVGIPNTIMSADIEYNVYITRKWDDGTYDYTGAVWDQTTLGESVVGFILNNNYYDGNGSLYFPVFIYPPDSGPGHITYSQCSNNKSLYDGSVLTENTAAGLGYGTSQMSPCG